MEGKLAFMRHLNHPEMFKPLGFLMRPDHFNQNRSKAPPNYEMQLLLRYNVATLSAGHAYPEHCTV